LNINNFPSFSKGAERKKIARWAILARSQSEGKACPEGHDGVVKVTFSTTPLGGKKSKRGAGDHRPGK
jgi:hypothetical protein